MQIIFPFVFDKNVDKLIGHSMIDVDFTIESEMDLCDYGTKWYISCKKKEFIGYEYFLELFEKTIYSTKSVKNKNGVILKNSSITPVSFSERILEIIAYKLFLNCKTLDPIKNSHNFLKKDSECNIRFINIMKSTNEINKLKKFIIPFLIKQLHHREKSIFPFCCKDSIHFKIYFNPKIDIPNFAFYIEFKIIFHNSNLHWLHPNEPTNLNMRCNLLNSNED